MIIARIENGLGNQLFKYAAGRALSLKHRTSLYTIPGSVRKPHETFILSKYFNVQAKSVSPFLLQTGFRLRLLKGYENHSFGFDPRFETTRNNTVVSGNFQSARYFLPFFDQINRELTLKPEVVDGLESVYPHVLESLRTPNSVCVHIRLGDYVSSGYDICGPEYYAKAISRLQQLHGELRAFVFSDTPQAASRFLPADIDAQIMSEFPEVRDAARSLTVERSTIRDYFLMQQCRHFVIPNSSFSYWAALLSSSDGDVIYPNRWYIDIDTSPRDLGLAPAEWTPIPLT
ncbi:alpha-1,2-fucosyltransferase [Rubinisphaera brasiliensis]|uniref:Glycosyl transferase family 11 n=1 Tax=Rubinisphaera brasiliensis (strain ATCC 49424 / DSM 5305 / JCM 21570 / IAM 15109 / NBRC 103401 / IFAM 1448) TaxID=756272 RepID=F0SI42_RUBBR|nr:alpha-1,2-fucosyltransferase [Rubinisphaera brasiliensis]ADY61744.1 glycosyl transferase family 11 [Rubinisphaera brasiliensis DSM 5305]